MTGSFVHGLPRNQVSRKRVTFTLTGQLTASLTPTEPDPTTPPTTVASTTVASADVGSDRVAADIAVLVAQLPTPTSDPTTTGHQHRGLGPVDPLP